MKPPGPRTPLGHLRVGLRILRDPYDLTWLHDRYGPVCIVGLGPTRFAYFLGADANEFVLSSGHERFRWREAFEMLIPVDGDTALVVTDGPEHARRRRLVQPAFALRRIDSYRPVIAEEATAFVDRALAAGELDVHAELRRTIRRIAIRTLFGDALGDRAEQFGDRMQVAIDYANLLPFLQRGRRRRKAMAATAELDGVIYAELARRRASEPGHDLLASLLETELTDVEIRDQVVSLIAAGYDTTTAHASWTVWEVARRPPVVERLRGEDADAYLDAVLNESLRLTGPAPLSTRYAPDGFTFAGVDVPPGTRVIWSPAVSHRSPEHWDDPLRFDPDRWLPGGSAATDPPPPHVFVPFGGGYRRCIGFALATLEVRTIVAELFARADVEVLDTVVKPAGLAAMYPKGGIRVRVTARSRASHRVRS